LVVDRACTENTYQSSGQSNSRAICTCNSNDSQKVEELIQIFLSVFSEVITVPSGTRALSKLRDRESERLFTILLIDIDCTEGINRDLYTRRESFMVMSDGVSLQEITTTRDTLYGLELLKHI
ncbi:18102_t:CDS:2, partial [Acaulospora morrowiae]